MPSTDLAIELSRLEYRVLPTPFASAAGEPLHAMRRLAERVGEATAAFAAAAGGAFDDYCIGSTLNSLHLSDPELGRDVFKRDLARYAGMPPAIAVNVYECTNWAFLLREGLARSRLLGRPWRRLVQVVDCDIHGVAATWRTRTYGNARFGILSMDVRLDHGKAAPEIAIDAAPVSASMMKFGSRLRACGRARPDAVLSPPFFPEPTRGAFRKTVSGLPCLPDHHDEYGHCFGADPWIGVGLAHAEAADTDRTYLVGSLALNGYHALGVVGVPAGASCMVERP